MKLTSIREWLDNPTGECLRCGKVGLDSPWGPSFNVCDYFKQPEATRPPDPPTDCWIARHLTSNP